MCGYVPYVTVRMSICLQKLEVMSYLTWDLGAEYGSSEKAKSTPN